MITLFEPWECMPLHSRPNHFMYVGAWPFDTLLRDEVKDYIGQQVYLGVGGGVAVIKGVDSYATFHLRKGATVGILVEHKPIEVAS